MITFHETNYKKLTKYQKELQHTVQSDVMYLFNEECGLEIEFICAASDKPDSLELYIMTSEKDLDEEKVVDKINRQPFDWQLIRGKCLFFQIIKKPQSQILIGQL